MSDIKKTEDILSVSGVAYDHKHINNLCDRAVPQEILDQIEQGCPIETLEKIAGDFPICKYMTQITIHGRFPVTSTRRIGEYVNLVRNKNESIGIRWTAIDHDKKKRLFRVCRIVAGYNVIEDSTQFLIRKQTRLTAENHQDVLASYQAEANRIDRALFTGDAGVWIGQNIFGMKYAVLDVAVKSFYERDFAALASSICNLPYADIERKVEEYETEKKREREAWELERAERQKQYEIEKRETEAANAAWLVANPSPFPQVENHILEVGDIYAIPKGENALRTRYSRWAFYKVSKSFGKLIQIPCDENGEPLKGDFGRRAKGHAIYNAGKAGTYYLKQKTKPSIASKPVRTPVTASERTIQATATGKPEMRLNAEKHGIELHFSGIPSDAVRTSLKTNGWRWSKFARCWYVTDTETNRDFARSMCA